MQQKLAALNAEHHRVSGMNVSANLALAIRRDTCNKPQEIANDKKKAERRIEELNQRIYGGA